MKKTVVGILAHVDAGKTTLTESILLNTGMIRTAGRVDDGNAFLDTEELEKKRGVTILSKQAIIDMSAADGCNNSDDDVRITIIDTPGHTDFIGETERALSVLDVAVLLISGPDGVTASTRRLYSMLETYKVPFFVFINKMDMCDRESSDIIEELSELGDGFVDFSGVDGGLITSELGEEVAALSESTIEKYLETGEISREDVVSLISGRKLHPCMFGSALKNSGVQEFIKSFTGYMPEVSYRDEFAARVYRISYEDGHKISFAKLTGGELSVRDSISVTPQSQADISEEHEEKISQIRLYSGGRYESINKASAGDVVALLGLESAYTGMGLGIEADEKRSLCQPVLRYEIILPIDTAPRVFIPKFKELVSENPLLYLEISENEKITISVMGEFQLEILQAMILERCKVKVGFAPAGIILKETIAAPVIGYGHFEPLRHYAEVQILMEPLPRGTGIEVASALSVNDLGINWQKTILSTITNDLPTGVLTGSMLTDIRFTLINGRAHLKHTESQDFREAVRRAIRQGLMKAETVLLEPVFSLSMILPSDAVGRAMNDITQMGGNLTIDAQKQINGEQMAVLSGRAPARLVSDYQTKLTGFTSGIGSIDMRLSAYRECPEDVAEKLISEVGYDPDNDKDNLSGSVFIEHGAGYYVPWFESEALMHLPSRESDFFDTGEMSYEEKLLEEAERVRTAAQRRQDAAGKSFKERNEAIGTDEIDEILRNSTHSNAGSDKRTKRVYLTKNRVVAETRASSGKSADAASEEKNNKWNKNKKIVSKDKYLLVDGYNIIHAWKNLKGLLNDEESGDKQSIDLEAARYKLLDIMSEYRVLKGTEVIVVFDAYNVRGHFTEKMDYLGVHVVYTKEAETADQYIARFTIENAKNLDITVATSDGMIQLIIRGEDTRLMTAGDLERDVTSYRNSAIEKYQNS